MIDSRKGAELKHVVDLQGAWAQDELYPRVKALGTWDPFATPFELFQQGERGQDLYLEFNHFDLLAAENDTPDIVANMVAQTFNFEKGSGLWLQALRTLVIRNELIIPDGDYLLKIWW